MIPAYSNDLPGKIIVSTFMKYEFICHAVYKLFNGVYFITLYLYIIQKLPKEIKEFVDSCLQIHSTKRKTPEELLELPIFAEHLLRNMQEKEENLYKDVIVRKMDELYYLWQLAGGDITVELKKQSLIRSRPPILSIPK